VASPIEAQHPATREQRGAVEEPPVEGERKADHGDDGRILRGRSDLQERFDRRGMQRRLEKQIAARVAREAQLGKQRDRAASRRRHLQGRHDATDVEDGIAHAQIGRYRCDAQVAETNVVVIGHWLLVIGRARGGQ